MLQNPKFLQPSSQLVHPQTASTPLPFPQLHNISSPSFPILKQFKISRRELTMSGNTSFLLLLAFQALERLYPSTAQAEENPPDNNNSPQELNQTNAEVEQNPAENNNQDESFQTNAQVEENPAENNNRDEFSQTNAKIEENPADNNNLQTQPEENSPGNNIQQEELNVNKPSFNCSSRVPTKRAFLDTAIDGEPVGRIVIGLYGNDVPSGAERFSSIVSGAAGISYRRKEFVKIMPNYVQHGGLRSYGVDAEVARRSGSNMPMEDLKAEWERAYEKCPGVKNLAGTVSMIVRDPSKPPPKPKLVARNGKLEIDEEEVGTDPNGTEFVISIKDSPELDSSALVVGKVLEGMEVVKRIGQVKTVQENSSSPYFRVAKLIGDKRAVVAERGFNRPYSKVVITNCGLLN